MSAGEYFTIDAKFSDGWSEMQGYASWQTTGGQYIVSGAVSATIGTMTPRAMQVQLMMSEFGQLLGLDHYASESQMMNPEIPWGAEGRTGAGDRVGLAALSPNAGCGNRVGDQLWR